MRFLLDTNIVIPAEPSTDSDVEANTAVVMEFLKAANQAAHKVSVHPASFIELQTDKNQERRRSREVQLGKYPRLEDPPPISQTIIDELGQPEPGSNNEADFLILSALQADCADILVTEDQKLRARAQRVNLGPRVSSAADALSTIRALFPDVPRSPPLVTAIRAYGLNEKDPIFNSLRSDYPPFDAWLKKCKTDHRQCWVIGSSGNYGGVAIVKDERNESPDTRPLKICTFKISERHRGNRYGELLLKTLFNYMFANAFDTAYVEVFPKHQDLVDLFEDFGFSHTATKQDGQLILTKRLKYSPDDVASRSAYDFNIQFGPHHMKFAGTDIFVTPIQPRFHQMLFPEAGGQMPLGLEASPFSNSMRKAYLSHSRITKLTPGAILLFYRSEDTQAITAVGVIEGTLHSTSPESIARFVGKRTVYTYEQIEKLSKKMVLAVLFRLSRVLPEPWDLDLLKRSGILKAAPQSFLTVDGNAAKWIATQLSK